MNHSQGLVLAVISRFLAEEEERAIGACAESSTPLGASRFSVKTCDRNSNAIKRLAKPLQSHREGRPKKSQTKHRAEDFLFIYEALPEAFSPIYRL